MAKIAKILIIYSNYYEDITRELLRGAVVELEDANTHIEKIEVPGVLEIPAALAMAVKSGNYDGYVVLGCVIRGETTHYDIVANCSAQAILDLVCKKRLALGNGIQTVENQEQAWARANVSDKNKGGGAASTALAMVKIRNKFKG